jgi:hypothetical protein
MTRIWIGLLAASLLATGAHAQGAQDTHRDLIRRDVPRTPDAPPPTRAWPQVPGVTPVQVAQLIDRISAVAGDQSDAASMDVLLSIQEELARQTRSVKSAYRSSLGGEDVDRLFTEVFDGQPDADPQTLEKLASAFETLYIQFGQFMNARFLVANRGGVAVYGPAETNRSADASAVAQAAEPHVTAYQAGINQSVTTLRRLVSLEARR